MVAEKRPLVIVGDSSFGEVAFELLSASGKFDVVGFAVNKAYRKRDTLLGRPVLVLEELEEIHPAATVEVFVALTYRELNRARARLCRDLKSRGYSLASYVSARAEVWDNVSVGENTFIFEHNTVQPFCSIGDNVILWSGNHIGHHSVIHDNVFIASQVVVSGHCVIGENSFIGVNATIADQVVVAKDSWIGPGSLITKNTEEGAMYRTQETPKSLVGARRFFRVSDD